MLKYLLLLLPLSCAAFTVKIHNESCGSVGTKDRMDLTVYTTSSHGEYPDACSVSINGQHSLGHWNGNLYKDGTATITLDDTYIMKICNSWVPVGPNKSEICNGWKFENKPCSYIAGPTGQMVGVLTLNGSNDGNAWNYKKGFLGCYPHKN